MQPNLTLSPLMTGVSEPEAIARAGDPEAGKAERGESGFAGVLDREVRSGQTSGREDSGSDSVRGKDAAGHEDRSAEEASQSASGDDAPASVTSEETAEAPASEAASPGRQTGKPWPEETVAEAGAAAAVLNGLPVSPGDETLREAVSGTSDTHGAAAGSALGRALDRAEALRAIASRHPNVQGVDDTSQTSEASDSPTRPFRAVLEALDEATESALDAVAQRIGQRHEPVRDRLANALRELTGLTGGELPRRPVESVAGPASAPQVALAAVAGDSRSMGGTQPVQLGLDAVFGRTSWDQALGEKVTWMIGQKLQAAEIRMNPPHLGPLEVKIQWHNDQTQIQFTSHHAVVRDALETALPRLRELMSQAGIDLGQVDVSAYSQGGDRQQEHAGQAGGEGASASTDWHPREEETPQATRSVSGARPRAGLDLFA